MTLWALQAVAASAGEALQGEALAYILIGIIIIKLQVTGPTHQKQGLCPPEPMLIIIISSDHQVCDHTNEKCMKCMK
jgi:hypothetical protein